MFILVLIVSLLLSLLNFIYGTLLLCADSPIGETFRDRLRMFPSLVNCCTIDWFSAWPDEALQSVARSYMADITELDVEGPVMDGLVSKIV